MTATAPNAAAAGNAAFFNSELGFFARCALQLLKFGNGFFYALAVKFANDW
jgi:hypothetical protein